MKRYFKNLWMALTGCDPFRDELEEKNSQLENAAENVQALQDQLYAALNKWEGSAIRAEELSGKLASERQMVHDLEVLIENLRERINEKDTLMERMKQDYQQRITQYTQKIEELQGKKA